MQPGLVFPCALISSPPLPLRRVFKQVLLPRVNFPLFITSVSRALMFSWLFFCRHISGVYSARCPDRVV